MLLVMLCTLLEKIFLNKNMALFEDCHPYAVSIMFSGWLEIYVTV